MNTTLNQLENAIELLKKSKKLIQDGRLEALLEFYSVGYSDRQYSKYPFHLASVVLGANNEIGDRIVSLMNEMLESNFLHFKYQGYEEFLVILQDKRYSKFIGNINIKDRNIVLFDWEIKRLNKEKTIEKLEKSKNFLEEKLKPFGFSLIYLEKPDNDYEDMPY